ncbi:MAG: sarcosine oxidase subunit gamma [Actinophytocola sp.]|nr:sarcosine oxidase subunit gamma [Actinophytocola sp.]
MTADIATRRSPLDGWTSRFTELAPAVRLAERPFLAQLTLRLTDTSRAAAVSRVLGVELPETPCTFSSGTGPHGPVEVAWLGPDEYLVLAQPGLQRTLESALREAIGDTHGAVVDVSAQRTTLTLSGPRARDLLAHGCAIDLHPSASPIGTCVQTLLAQAGIILLVRDADAGEFVVLVRASFATYLAAWLVDAGMEYREYREQPV